MIGLMADAQHADREPTMGRWYRKGAERLREAVGVLEAGGSEVLVHLGDLIDREAASFGPALAALGTARVPVWQVAGNHDFEVADSEKQRVREWLGIWGPSPWRSEDLGRWRVLLVDTNILGPYAWSEGSEGAREAQRVHHAAAEAELEQARPWNGGLGDAQLAWMDRECAEAAAAGRPVVVMAHHPVHPAGRHVVLDREAVDAVIRRHAGVVRLWVNGHDHRGGHAVVHGVHFVTLHGMVETETENAFGLLELDAEGGRLRGFGRQPDIVMGW